MYVSNIVKKLLYRFISYFDHRHLKRIFWAFAEVCLLQVLLFKSMVLSLSITSIGFLSVFLYKFRHYEQKPGKIEIIVYGSVFQIWFQIITFSNNNCSDGKSDERQAPLMVKRSLYHLAA